MAQTQAAIAETISAMKIALKRKASDAALSSNVPNRSNRGNKLHLRARDIQQARLDDTGALSWRQRVNHAGWLRNTISTNPKRYDQYGYLYEEDDEDADDEDVEYEDENPFGEVQLEELLRPLNSAADLAEHPSLKHAFESRGLTQMADEASETLRRERQSLWKAKRLLRRFRGDGDWVPCELFETQGDEFLLPGGVQSAVPSITTEQPMAMDLEAPVQPAEDEDMDPSKSLPAEIRAEGEAMEGIEAIDQAAPAPADNTNHAETDLTTQDPAPPAAEGDSTASDPPTNPQLTDLLENNSETASNSATTEQRHAMTTRNQARARSPSGPPSPSPSSSASIPEIHPWFTAPPTALFDRDLGLPAAEAEDTRKLLLLYVQKQEQICRSLDELCSGLQKADRLRKEVMKAAKAEGHVGDMSDGEDWYDEEEFGVLEKGKDEVEDVEEERRGRAGRGRRVNRI